MKILITGGARYVGSKLVPNLLKLGHEVTVLDLMIYGAEVLDDHEKLKKIKGDIRNINLLKEFLIKLIIFMNVKKIFNDS